MLKKLQQKFIQPYNISYTNSRNQKTPLNILTHLTPFLIN